MIRGHNSKATFVIALVVILLIIAGLLLFSQTEPEASMKSSNAEIVRGVEKDLIALQLRQLSTEEFQTKMTPLVYSYYQEEYFNRIQKHMNYGVAALNVKFPENIEVSKAYANSKGNMENVFVKIPIDDSTNHIYKTYTFKQQGEEWKLFQVAIFFMTEGNQKQDFIRAKFQNYNGQPIEYRKLIKK